MEVLYPRCCGLAVHKSSITACVRLQQAYEPQPGFSKITAITS
jgi:hypothetical protein